jgi:hypothetical protein
MKLYVTWSQQHSHISVSFSIIPTELFLVLDKTYFTDNGKGEGGGKKLSLPITMPLRTSESLSVLAPSLLVHQDHQYCHDIPKPQDKKLID